VVFSASIRRTSQQVVRWSVVEGPAGGSVTSAGVYTAPAAAGTYHVKAASVYYGGTVGFATVTVSASTATTPVAITPTTAALTTGGTVTFSANQPVSWTVVEGSAGGAVSSTGVYTAPSTAGTYHVQATSTASPANSTTATVSVTSSTSSVTCTSFTYSAWSACSSSGTQTRTVTSSSPAGCTGGSPVLTQSCTPSSSGTYDDIVLADKAVAFWGMRNTSGTEPDLTGNGNAGTYKGGTPATVTMPNGDAAADFNGSSQYLTVPSRASLSIPTTGSLTWEAWIRPDTLQFPNQSSDGYTDWMGKCQDYSPTCEWEARIYSTSTAQGRPNRFSAYVFNPSAGLGSGADWQPVSSLIVAGHWYHVVGEYTTLSQPSGCSSSYPGSINIWVNGVPWNQAAHSPTGCMSQYSVKPVANNSPLNIGTMAMDYWFKGAIGKVAIYSYLLSQEQISNHYKAMTGRDPSGSCSSTCTLTNP